MDNEIMDRHSLSPFLCANLKQIIVIDGTTLLMLGFFGDVLTKGENRNYLLSDKNANALIPLTRNDQLSRCSIQKIVIYNKKIAVGLTNANSVIVWGQDANQNEPISPVKVLLDHLSIGHVVDLFCHEEHILLYGDTNEACCATFSDFRSDKAQKYYFTSGIPTAFVNQYDIGFVLYSNRKVMYFQLGDQKQEPRDIGLPDIIDVAAGDDSVVFLGVDNRIYIILNAQKRDKVTETAEEIRIQIYEIHESFQKVVFSETYNCFGLYGPEISYKWSKQVPDQLFMLEPDEITDIRLHVFEKSSNGTVSNDANNGSRYDEKIKVVYGGNAIQCEKSKLLESAYFNDLFAALEQQRGQYRPYNTKRFELPKDFGGIANYYLGFLESNLVPMLPADEFLEAVKFSLVVGSEQFLKIVYESSGSLREDGWIYLYDLAIDNHHEAIRFSSLIRIMNTPHHLCALRGQYVNNPARSLILEKDLKSLGKL